MNKHKSKIKILSATHDPVRIGDIVERIIIKDKMGSNKVKKNKNTRYATVEQLNVLEERLDKRIVLLETKVDALEKKVNKIEFKVNTIETKVNMIETKVNMIETKVDMILAKLS